MAIKFLEGRLVYLRPFERSDAPDLLPWVNDPHVTRTLLFARPVNLQAEERFIEQVSSSADTVVLGIAEHGTDRLVGSVGLHGMDPATRQAQFGIFIGNPADWNKGYCTEATRLIVGYAFDTLNLHRVWLHVVASNAAGIRAYEKVGFKREGVLREAHYREGRYQDLIAMGLLREELVRG
jgi:RimJ/RimL family protein N-acetyltransferase